MQKTTDKNWVQKFEFIEDPIQWPELYTFAQKVEQRDLFFLARYRPYREKNDNLNKNKNVPRNRIILHLWKMVHKQAQIYTYTPANIWLNTPERI